MKEFLKERENGITLIALVITIVILLILAGVTIATLTGDNGILTQANNAKEHTEKETEKEKIKMAVVACQSKSEGNTKIDIDDLKNELQQQLDETFEVSDNKDNSFLITIDEERMYYINREDKVIDDSNILKITSIDELEDFRNKVSSGESFSDKVVILINDITLNEDWTPIGYIDDENIIKFNGEFNGLNNKINNLNINSPEKSYQGLFASTGKSAIINSVIISGSITGAKYVGAVVGYNEGNINNCGNEANITSTNELDGNPSIGGIAGYNANGNINGCYNKGEISAARYSTGGIVGKSEGGEIKNCYNNATIRKDGEKGKGETGGICGTAIGTNFYNVYNAGEIIAIGSETGGIVGLASDGKMTNAYNIGEIQANDNVGGIIGNAGGKQTIEKSYNKGNITAKNNVAGIIGSIRNTEDVKINNCYQYGNVEAINDDFLGTITGRTTFETCTKNCEWYTDNQEYYNKMIARTSIKFNENINMKNVLEIVNGDNFFVANNDNNNPRLYWE